MDVGTAGEKRGSNPLEGVHLSKTKVMKVKENEKIFNFSVPKFKELFILWRVQVNVSTHRQKINLVNNKWFEPNVAKNGTYYVRYMLREVRVFHECKKAAAGLCCDFQRSDPSLFIEHI